MRRQTSDGVQGRFDELVSESNKPKPVKKVQEEKKARKKKEVQKKEDVQKKKAVQEKREKKLEESGESKRVEEGRVEREEWLKDIAESAAEWFWEIDVDGKFTYASSAIKKILGYKPKEVLGRHFYDRCHPDDREELKKVGMKGITQKQPFFERVSRHTHKNGKMVWLSTTGVPLVDREGNFRGYRGATVDITERRLAEKEVYRQKQMLEDTLESLPHPFYVVNANDYTIELANSAAKQGKPTKNTKCYKLTHRSSKPCRGPEHVCPVEEVKKTKKPVTAEHVHYDEDGNKKNVEVHGYPIFDKEGNVPA